MSFQSRLALSRKKLLEFLSHYDDLFLLMDGAGNVGDQLIKAGSKDLLVSAGISFEEVASVSAEEHQRSGTLLVRGSGAFDRLFNAFMPELVLRASRQFRNVIILPTSFDPRELVVSRVLEQPNVFAFAREATSYAAIRGFGRGAQSLDCALYYRGFEGALNGPRPAGSGGRVLLALRTDRASLLGNSGLTPNPSFNDDVSLTASGLDDFIDKIGSSDCVITDRLHVAVATVMLGRRLQYLEAHANKLSTYFEYTFGDSFRDRMTECSPEWLLAAGFVLQVERHR